MRSLDLAMVLGLTLALATSVQRRSGIVPGLACVTVASWIKAWPHLLGNPHAETIANVLMFSGAVLLLVYVFRGPLRRPDAGKTLDGEGHTHQ